MLAFIFGIFWGICLGCIFISWTERKRKTADDLHPSIIEDLSHSDLRWIHEYFLAKGFTFVGCNKDDEEYPKYIYETDSFYFVVRRNLPQGRSPHTITVLANASGTDESVWHFFLNTEEKEVLRWFDEYLLGERDTYYSKGERFCYLVDRKGRHIDEIVVGRTAMLELSLPYYIGQDYELFLNGYPIDNRKTRIPITFNHLGTQFLEVVAIGKERYKGQPIVVDVVESPEVHVFLETSKELLRKGKHEKAVLKWNIENAASAVISNGVTERRLWRICRKGTWIVSPDKTTEYRIRAFSKSGEEVIETVTIRVEAENKASFVAENVDNELNKFCLRWHVENAKWVFIDRSYVPFSGERIVRIEGETTFVLKVKDDFGISFYPLTIRPAFTYGHN